MKLGIDFGTCYSFPAALRNGIPTSLLTYGGNVGIPSVFYYDSDTKEQVGWNAEEYGGEHPENMVSNIKSAILKSRTYSLGGKDFNTIDICSQILKNIVLTAEEEAGVHFEEAVISIPVHFGAGERRILTEAALVPKDSGGPGLLAVEFIQEPVAAALAYAEQYVDVNDRYILVYDMGGGTFDAALIQRTDDLDPPYKVIDFEGCRIGGNDFDRLLFNYLKAAYESEYGLRISQKRDRFELMKTARAVKEKLSGRDQTAAEYHHNDGRVMRHTVTREQFENLISEKVDATVEMMEDLAGKHNLLTKDGKLVSWARLIMVGGSSLIPVIKMKLAEKLGTEKERIRIYQPDRAIAFGAARYAEENDILMRISPYSYGVKAYFNNEPNIINLIRYKDELPICSKWEKFMTRHPNQKAVGFDVYENYATSIKTPLDGTKEKRKLMSVILEFNHEVPQGTLVEAQLVMDAKGNLSVRAHDPSKKERQVEEQCNIKYSWA